MYSSLFFFFNDTATTEIYTLSLHDALPIFISRWFYAQKDTKTPLFVSLFTIALNIMLAVTLARPAPKDRKSTRLNSSHLVISYAVFCLKKKNENNVKEGVRFIRMT